MQRNITLEDFLSETGSYFHCQSTEKVNFLGRMGSCVGGILLQFSACDCHIKKMEIMKMQDGEVYRIGAAA